MKVGLDTAKTVYVGLVLLLFLSMQAEDNLFSLTHLERGCINIQGPISAMIITTHDRVGGGRRQNGTSSTLPRGRQGVCWFINDRIAVARVVLEARVSIWASPMSE